jgi:hypothetical protein
MKIITALIIGVIMFQKILELLGIQAQGNQSKLVSPIPEPTPTISPMERLQRQNVDQQDFREAQRSMGMAQKAPQMPKKRVPQVQTSAGEVLGTNDDFQFNYDPYMQHMSKPYNIPQPPPDLAQIFRDTFPEDATRSAITAWTESAFNPKAKYTNTKGRLRGSDDMGLMMINAGKPSDPSQITTFDDLMRRKPGQMEQAGVAGQQSLFNPAVNARVAKINMQESPQGWHGRWFGLRDKGFLPEHFTGQQSPF